MVCLGCGQGAEVLYWPLRFGQALPGSEAANLAGCCQDCCRLRMLSEGHGQEVAALRADLRLGSLESVQQAIEAGRYVPARTALELEGRTTERLFTRPPAARTRWNSRTLEQTHGLSR